MFIGHPAIAFAARPLAPRTNVGLTIGATWLVDLLWPVFLLAGLEHVSVDPHPSSPFLVLNFTHYPWTHSLLMGVVWSVLAGAAYYASTKYGRGAVLIGACVVSHWFLDFVTHRPDLPLYPGGPKVGLGLWRYPAATIVIELTMFAIGVFIYARRTRARDRIGSIGFWSFIAVLLFFYGANITGPPPPSPRALAWFALSAVILPLWPLWFDRHRVPVE